VDFPQVVGLRDLDQRFNAPVEVSVHHVGRADENIRIAPIGKREDAAVL